MEALIALLSDPAVRDALMLIGGAILAKLVPTKVDSKWWNASIGKLAPKLVKR